MVFAFSKISEFSLEGQYSRFGVNGNGRNLHQMQWYWYGNKCIYNQKRNILNLLLEDQLMKSVSIRLDFKSLDLKIQSETQVKYCIRHSLP